MAMFIQKPWYKSSGGGGLKIVSFTDGTDDEISAMLDAYYNDEITWAEMGWAVGDTRKIHLNSFDCPNPFSSYSVAAQEITVVIVAHDHTPLATSINGHTNACITVNFRETLGSDSYNGKDGSMYLDGNSAKDTSFTKWSNLYARTYINSTLLDAFSYSTDKGSGTSFKSLIKQSKHYRHTAYNTTESEEVTDTLFFPSYPEIFGTATYSYYKATNPIEGTQFEYYTNSSNRIKHNNNNGSPMSRASYWWQGSCASYYSSTNGYFWCGVTIGGASDCYNGASASSLAPAWAM